MSRAISGAVGFGSVVAYTLAPRETFSLDTISFELIADNSGGGHSPEILMLAKNGATIARIPDWNDVADGSVVTYTFGVGLTPFCGVTNSGGAVQNDLPQTIMEEGCSVVVRSVDSSGTVVAGDSIGSVTLWVEDSEGAAPVLAPGPLTLVPGQEIAA